MSLGFQEFKFDVYVSKRNYHRNYLSGESNNHNIFMVYVVSARCQKLQTKFTHTVVSNTVMNVKSDMYKMGRMLQLPTLRPHLDRSKGSPR
jgi:hypothetical protein